MAHKKESTTVFRVPDLAKSGMEFQFWVPHFGALYLATQADLDLDSLKRVVV
jgi:hypothetical protein